ncbi:MAG: DNA repair exonuclease [Clostridia bacterium]|nr:DNA repair exonuclease [Clostridia bacterium]
MIKILHTGDIHLDSAFSRLDSRHAEIRRNELRAAFTSMMAYAKLCGADLMLISGDLTDSQLVTRESAAMLCREFTTFGKPVFIAPGNHDPATQKSIWLRDSLPENVHVFTKPEVEAFDLDELNLTVYGFGFDSPDLEVSPLKNVTVEDRSRVNLLVCHCDMRSTVSIDCPVTEDELLAFGADYAALGHVHNPAEYTGNRWCYCGCLEPRGFDECGIKGACVVEIDKKGEESDVNVRRVRFAKRRYEKGELALDTPRTQSDVREAVDNYIREMKYGEDTLLSLTLTGTVSSGLVIDTEALSDNPSPLFLLDITDRTVPDADPAVLERDITVRGEVYRKLKPLLESSDERNREVGLRALRYALAALEE